MINKVANRYAKAVYELAVENNTVDVLISDMILIHEQIAHSSELSSMILSPVINSDVKKMLLNKTILNDKNGLSDLTKKIIDLLLRKKRITFLDDVCLSVVAKNKVQNNIVDARVESAFPLDNNQINTVKKYLEDKFSKTVNIENPINEKLVGGFRILVDDVLIDHSLLTHFSDLRTTMVTG